MELIRNSDLFLYFGSILLNNLGYYFVVLLISFATILFLANSIRKYGIAGRSVFIALCTYPILTPAIAVLLNYTYFTAMNPELQNDLGLIIGSQLHILSFASLAYVGMITYHPQPKPAKPINITALSNNILFIGLFTVSIILMMLFLEGDSIISVGYVDARSESSIYSSTAQQAFNTVCALSFAIIFSNRRIKIINIFCLLAFIVCVLYSKRTLAMAIAVLWGIYRKEDNINFGRLFLIFLALAVLVIIGEARSVGIVNYINGYRGVSIDRTYLQIPGGGANIFLANMGVLDMLSRNVLIGAEQYPFISWLTQSTSENSIYANKGYQYNGGMHIASVLLWNFGLPGFVIFSLLLGRIYAFADATLGSIKAPYYGGLGAVISVLFILLMPQIVWYNPSAIVRPLILVTLIFLILGKMSRTGGLRSHGTQQQVRKNYS